MAWGGSPSKQRHSSFLQPKKPTPAEPQPVAEPSVLGRTSAEALRALWALFGPAFWCFCLFVTLFFTMESRRATSMRALSLTNGTTACSEAGPEPVHDDG